MRRWIVKAGATSLDQLVMEPNAPKPSPGTGEVRVKVHAVSLNRRDHLLLSGQFGSAPSDFVAVADGAGTIEAVGDDVGAFAVGDRVVTVYFPGWPDGPPARDMGWGLGSPGQDGVLADYVVLPAARVVPAPATLSFDEAATLPCAALTAWTALNGDRPYKNRIKTGDRVLAVGTGGVSLFAALIAQAAGASAAMTTSSDDKAERLKALGVASVVNYRTEPEWGRRAGERVGGFDRVVNAAGTGSLDQSIAALASGGEVALMGLYEFADKSPDFIALMAKGASIRGTSVGSAAALRDLVAFVDEHRIKPPIARVFGFDEAHDAYRALDEAADLGKIVIQIDG